MRKRELQRKRNRVAKKRKKKRMWRKKKKLRKMRSKGMVKSAKEKFFCWRTWVIGDTERMF